MKLNIPAMRHQHKAEQAQPQGLGLGLVQEHQVGPAAPRSQPTPPNHQAIVSLSTTIEYVSEEMLYQTPNATMHPSEQLAGYEDFRTPLAEMPLPLLLQATQYYDSGETSESDEYPNEDSGDNDSGLEENYHTPRVAKIKSMENLSILEMEFHKASMELDRNSPRRLKQLAERAQIPKMKSLNNLCFDDYSEEAVREEFQRIRDQSLEERLRVQQHNYTHHHHLHNLHSYGLRKNSTTSNGSSGKLFVKHQSHQSKVGNAKFIGQDSGNDSPQTSHHPIQKMRSMGTIPDVVSERIEADPFLTPTSERRPSFNRLIQSADKPALGNNSGNNSYVNRLLTYDVVDSPAESFTNAVSFMSRTPFERAYRRTMLQGSSSTPLATQEPPHLVRPHSTNAAYELMRCVAFYFEYHTNKKYEKQSNSILN